jgi:hypothetical protein
MSSHFEVKMQSEIWKDIPNYEGYYMASNKGKIKSMLFQNNVLNKKYPREKILKPKTTKDCCKRVDLWKNGQHKTFLVHRLIATTFLENLIDTNMTVNHKDGNRLNNNLENLEWVSIAENIKLAFKFNQYSSTMPVAIINKNTGKIKTFSSLSEGSKFIGENYRYLSENINKGIFENQKYSWAKL